MEQGGIPSVQLYQLVTDLDLVVLNSRGAGDPVGPMYLASLGQTDDQVFVSFSLFANGSGLDSAVEMATAINLVNVPSKKKVIVVMPRDSLVRMLELLDVDGVSVLVSSQVTLPGKVCSLGKFSNQQALVERNAAYTRVLALVLCAGLNNKQRVKFVISLRVHALYAALVLYSGSASFTRVLSHLHSTCPHEFFLQRLPSNSGSLVFSTW